MPNLLQLNGSQSGTPTRYAPIWVNRFFQGLWTNRNPLRDAGSTRVEEKFYGSRGDALIDGLNVELTPRLTMARRAGFSLYNSTGTFQPINNFYSFKYVTGNPAAEVIKVIGDSTVGGGVYDVTAGGTGTTLFTRSAGAGQTNFLSVGNTLFMYNGVDSKKWLQASKVWTALTAVTGFYQADTKTVNDNVLPFYITDSNNNIQQVTVSGTTGAVQPTWPTTTGATTVDGDATWTCMGSAVKNIGLATPTVTPTLTPVTASGNKMWAPSETVTAPFALFDDNGNIQIALTSGVTGATYPSFNTSLNGQTTDNSVIWYNSGAPGSWQASYNFPSYFPIIDPNGNLQVASKATGTQIGSGDVSGYANVNDSSGGSTYTFVVIAYFGDGTHTGTGNPIVVSGSHFTLHWNAVANVDHYKIFCTNITGTAGTVVGTGAIHGTGSKNTGTGPSFSANTTLYYLDNGAWYTAAGDGTTAPTNNTASVSGTFQESNTTIPTFATAAGATTLDSNGVQPGVTWTCYGPAQRCVFIGYDWVYCYHSVNGHVSSASPLTQTGPVIGQNFVAALSGPGADSTQVDEVWIFRTVDGGASYLYAGAVPNPGALGTWSFTDNLADDVLNEFISAPTNGANNPPPSGATAPAYHVGRVFIAVTNTVQWSQSFNTVGVASESFPASNYFTFPSAVTRMVTCSIGLLVYTVSDVYLIFGLGTSNSPFQTMVFEPNIGLSNYNALVVDGTTNFLLANDGTFLTIHPGVSGVQELGFPIADKLATVSPSTAYITHHVSGLDRGIYAADSTGWYRCSTPLPPEYVPAWSPKGIAALGGNGIAAMQSVEVSPGVRKLLVSQNAAGKILQRDTTVTQDIGNSFNANLTLGSMVLAQPGQIAEIEHIVVETVGGGDVVTVGVLLDEALPYYTGAFQTLKISVTDPPELPPSTSITANRYYFAQTQTSAWCRHLQMQVSWGVGSGVDELLGLTLFGTHWQHK